MKTILIILFLVCLDNASALLGGGGYNRQSKTNPEEECDECTFLVDDAVDDLKELLGNMEPKQFDGSDPCEGCYFFGGATLERNGPACTKKRKDHYIQTFKLKFSKIGIQCNCSLSKRLDTLVKVLTKSAAVAMESVCNLDESRDVDESEKHEFPYFNPNSCLPKLGAAIGSVGTVIEKDNLYAAASTTWENVRISLSLRIKRNEPIKVKKISILNRNYSKIKATCKTSKGGETACECVANSNFLKSIIVHAVENAIPCAINDKLPDVTDLLEKLRCK